MRTMTVKTRGANVCGNWFDAGTYKPPILTEFEHHGCYWLIPLAELEGVISLGSGIRLGECHTKDQLENAIDSALRECGDINDPIWLLGATTEMDLRMDDEEL